MILTHDEIIKALQNEEVVINPFDERQLGTNSYDVRLGNWFAYVNAAKLYAGEAYDPLDKEQMLRVWVTKFVEFGGGFRLAPYQTVLGHTLEFIGGIGKEGRRLTTNFHTRSSSKRNLFDCNGGAGYGDVGYVGRWTLEITNHHPYPLILRPYQRVGQIEFKLAFGDSHLYGQKAESGKYGMNPDDWKPEDMLPKAWKDWDIDMVLNGPV